MNTNGSFGAWLKQRRKALDLTQNDLANQVGCAVTTIQKIEADMRRPSKQIAERLADVLALTPEAHTGFVSFARRIADPSPDSPVDFNNLQSMSNLPAQSTPFLGRENELSQIADRLTDPNCRLLTLVGVGGIGKTRLAVQAAADQLEDFTDGVYFVSLTPVGSTTLITTAIASALQISFYGQDNPNIQLVNYLRAKHMLLIMDNYEHLLGGVELLMDLLVAAPRLKILATSRERLNLQEEWVLPVEGLPFPVPPTKAEVGSYSAVQLFVQTARRLQPGFLLKANQEGVMDICQAVEGMPLGIELAATWLRAMPCQQIAGQIRRDLDFLATPLRNVQDRHRSMRAVFDHSWGLLSEAERNVLMKLSVFRGGIDPEAAQEVAQAPRWLLAGLVDKSFTRLNAAGRFELHELLRQFASDKLEEAGKTAETEHQHFQYFLGVAEQLNQWFFGPQHLVGMNWLEAELDNFRAALHWALRVEELNLGLELASALGWFWNRHGYSKEGLMWLETFLQSGQNIPVSLRALAIHHALELSTELSYKQHAAALFDEALKLVHEVQDDWLKAWLLNSLGFAEGFAEGFRRENSGEYHQQALELFTKLCNKWGMCETLSRLGYDLCQRGDFERAEELQKKGIEIARSEGDKGVLSWLLMLSAVTHRYQGKINAQTESMYLQSLVLFRELGYKPGAAMAQLHLGKFACLRHEYEQALMLFEESLKLMQQICGGDSRIWCLANLAEILCIVAQPEHGARLLGALEVGMQTIFPDQPLLIDEIKTDYSRGLAVALAELDEAQFAVAFAEGQAMTLDEAVTYALVNSGIAAPV